MSVWTEIDVRLTKFRLEMADATANAKLLGYRGVRYSHCGLWSAQASTALKFARLGLSDLGPFDSAGGLIAAMKGAQPPRFGGEVAK